MREAAVVTIGTFDGVHLGHQAILAEVKHEAERRSLRSIAYAFAVPPRWSSREAAHRFYLLPPAVRFALLQQMVDEVRVTSFETVRQLTPEAFVDDVLAGQLAARCVVEGASFRFGHQRAGDLATLRQAGARHGMDIIAVPPVRLDGEPVSSSRIRAAFRDGDIVTARRCLGRPPVLVGDVATGDRLGTKLGVATANLSVGPHDLLPRPGIFFVHAYGPEVAHAGLLYVGHRPTFAGRDLRCEVHLLDFPYRPLYAETLELHVIERIRDDRAFPSIDALRRQIEQDVVQARRLQEAQSIIDRRIGS